ncbi:MAG TPA: FxsA family protein [Polyangiales bacterium]|nr:FxsA family protein [Polyangiales bacterium]
MRVLFLLFAVLPLLEVFVLFKLGRTFGAAVPVLAVLASALCGAVVARIAGLRVLRSFRQALAAGTPPESSVIDGVLVLLACALLVMPGLISDVLGLCLLLPPVRKLVARSVTRRLVQAVQRGTAHVTQTNVRSVIDVEGEVVTEREDPKRLQP